MYNTIFNYLFKGGARGKIIKIDSQNIIKFSNFNVIFFSIRGR